jgi:hypothetical protein
MNNSKKTFTASSRLAALAGVALAALGLAAVVAKPQADSVDTKTNTGLQYTALPQKTNGTSVQIAHALSNKPAVGKATTLNLQIDALAAGTQATLKVAAAPSLGMTGGDVEKTIGAAASSLTLNFTPSANGLFYITVFTQQNGRSSTAQIAVQVGNEVQKPSVNGTLTTDGNGDKLIEMKAQ